MAVTSKFKIQRSLTPKCWQATTVRKPRTRIIGKCSPLHGHLLSHLRLRRTPLVRWFHIGVSHMDNGRVQSLSKPKSWSYVSDNWCLPRNGLALLWVGVSWNSFPVNAVSGPPGENVRVAPWVTETMHSNQGGIKTINCLLRMQIPEPAGSTSLCGSRAIDQRHETVFLLCFGLNSLLIILSCF